MKGLELTYNRSQLLAELSKIYVIGELNLDLKSFIATPDTAWVSFAAQLLRRRSGQRPQEGTGK